MGLKYYRIDCSKLTREQRNEVEHYVDIQSFIFVQQNPHLKSDYIYAYFNENYNFDNLAALTPFFKSCTVTETQPDFEP